MMGDELCGQGTIKVGVFWEEYVFHGLLSTALTFGLRIAWGKDCWKSRQCINF
jgi:hypothetical protein